MTTATIEPKERTWRVKLQPAAYDFVASEARYPALIAGWGYGKSLALIMRCLLAAKNYKNNLILIVRYSFTDLRDSTMRDFERYTGITVPSNKDVVLPNGSRIMFRHGSELAGLQNINLGAFGMEQAEEFDTDHEFQMLRGRLRRDGVPHFGAVIGNTQGHNWIWKLWKQQNALRTKEFNLGEATSFDNPHLPADFVEDLRRMETESPAKFKQYVLNSWDEMDVEGAYYAKLIGQARADKRIGNVPYDPTAKAYTFWDLGISDSTAIWFAQFIRKEIRLIDYYENSGESLQHYVKLLQNKPYVYDERGHWGPHDIQARTLQTGQTTLDVAKQLGVKFQVVDQHRIQEGIEAVRGLLPECWIDETKCQAGVEALEHYQRRKNEKLSTDEKSSFSDTPLHDWSSHGADAFRDLAMAYRYHLRIDDQLIGYPYPTKVADEVFEDDYNPLWHGLRIK